MRRTSVLRPRDRVAHEDNRPQPTGPGERKGDEGLPG
jgi:hypothetical protein